MGLEIEFYNNFIQFRVLNFNLVTTSEKETRVQTSCINATEVYAVGSKSFRPDQLFKATEIKQICYFSTQSPFTSTHFSTDTLISPQMALYIAHSIFHLARLLYVRPETFGPYCVLTQLTTCTLSSVLRKTRFASDFPELIDTKSGECPYIYLQVQ